MPRKHSWISSSVTQTDHKRNLIQKFKGQAESFNPLLTMSIKTGMINFFPFSLQWVWIETNIEDSIVSEANFSLIFYMDCFYCALVFVGAGQLSITIHFHSYGS